MHAMRTCGGEEVELQSFLTWAEDRSERSVFSPIHSTSRQRVPGNHSTARVGGLQGQSGGSREEKNSLVPATNQTTFPQLRVSPNLLPSPETEPRSPACTLRILLIIPTMSPRFLLNCTCISKFVQIMSDRPQLRTWRRCEAFVFYLKATIRHL
jgi:hypothetical protein